MGLHDGQEFKPFETNFPSSLPSTPITVTITIFIYLAPPSPVRIPMNYAFLSPPPRKPSAVRSEVDGKKGGSETAFLLPVQPIRKRCVYKVDKDLVNQNSSAAIFFCKVARGQHVTEERKGSNCGHMKLCRGVVPFHRVWELSKLN